VDTLQFSDSELTASAAAWRWIDLAERIAAAVLLVLLLPVISVAALVVVTLSRRSPFVAHPRIGLGGTPLWVLKLRTMWTGRGAHWSGLVEYLPVPKHCPEDGKSNQDSRVTSPFAAMCRRYSIDELPQLWQVARGEMALIAPRPLTLPEINRYYASCQSELLSRKPGLSGLWQVSGRSRLTYSQRRRLDLFMVRKWSVRLYLRIALATVPRVLAGKDAW
jgi:exopolysaccharide production protein ExoY